MLDEIKGADLLLRPTLVLEQFAYRLRRGALQHTPGHRQIKVVLLTSFTNDFLTDMLRLMLAHRGLEAAITPCQYGQLIPELMTGGQALNSNPDIVYVLPTHRDLQYAPGIGATEFESTFAVQNEVAFWSDLMARIDCPMVMLSFNTPPHRLLAEADSQLPGGKVRHIREVNAALGGSLGRTISLVDAEILQARVGPTFYDERLYALCKQPFAMTSLPEVADTLAAAAVGLLGLSRKVLVLDLDDTIWGGVIGDVGIQGITLGMETPEGEAFTNLQHYVVALARRGIILAICSKNDEKIALEAFNGHSAMILRIEDIACFVANYDDKASNLKLIAKTLNVGLDAMVFVDDNPVERAWVRQQLPDVWTIELPEDPHLYVSAIEAAKPFPLRNMTHEDLERTASYQLLKRSKPDLNQIIDMEEFLKNLESEVIVQRVDDSSVDRIVQLIAKTNQFKLNSTTYTISDILSKREHVIALRLKDRLQDYGIIAVTVNEHRDGQLTVLNWVMSCRVFNRRVEHVMTQILGDYAATWGTRTISAQYVSTSRNSMVPSSLRAIGFCDSEDNRFDLHCPVKPTAPHFMRVSIEDLISPITDLAGEN